MLGEIANAPYTLIFLETPHRLLESLADLESVLGNRQVAVARELTKLYEEIKRGSLSEVRSDYQKRPIQGEITLVVAGCISDQEQWPEEKLQAALHEAIANGEGSARAAGRIASESGWPRRKVYALYVGIVGDVKKTKEG